MTSEKREKTNGHSPAQIGEETPFFVYIAHWEVLAIFKLAQEWQARIRKKEGTQKAYMPVQTMAQKKTPLDGVGQHSINPRQMERTINLW